MADGNYWRRLSERQLGRRALLRAGGMVAAGVGAAALAACGRGSSSGTAKPAGPAIGAGAGGGQPVRGGILSGRINTDPPTTWLPAGSITYISVHPYASGYNQLVQYDPQDETKIIPDLADSYEVAADGKSIVFKLHPGVKFHDGSDFSSEDVKATIAWNLNPPAKKSSSQQGNLQAIDRVETPDPLTAKFVLKMPNPSLLGILATHLMPMGAKADLAKDDLGATTINGTGPFKLKSYTRGVGAEFERNPNYWVKDRPYLDGTRWSIVFDENSAMANLTAGQFHKYYPVLPDNVGRATKETGGKIKETSVRSPGRRILFFNATKKPFSDLRVRQAVSMVLDRNEAMLVDVLKPELGVAPGGYMIPGGPWASPTDQIRKVPGYDKPDIAEAKKLLAAAGVTEPLAGTLLTRSDTSFQPNATYIQGTLKKVLGWDYKLDVKDSASAFAATAATQFDLVAWNYQPAGDDPDATFGQLATRQANTNWSKVYDDEADALFLKQSQTLDAVERKKLVQQLEIKYLSNFPMLTMYFANSNHAIWTTVQNYKVPGPLYVNNRYQDVWLSKA